MDEVGVAEHRDVVFGYRLHDIEDQVILVPSALHQGKA
jgi:hypothetical protein